MYLSDHDLRQLDEVYLESLSEAQARALLGKALADLKAARELISTHSIPMSADCVCEPNTPSTGPGS